MDEQLKAIAQRLSTKLSLKGVSVDKTLANFLQTKPNIVDFTLEDAKLDEKAWRIVSEAVHGIDCIANLNVAGNDIAKEANMANSTTKMMSGFDCLVNNIQSHSNLQSLNLSRTNLAGWNGDTMVISK